MNSIFYYVSVYYVLLSFKYKKTYCVYIVLLN